jgi:hypothetical protein
VFGRWYWTLVTPMKMLNLKIIYRPRPQIYRLSPAPGIAPTPAAKRENDEAAPSLVEEWLKVQGIDPPTIDLEPFPQPLSALFAFRTRHRV